MKFRLIGLTFLLAGLLACNAFNHNSDTTNPAEPTDVEVDNQGFLDMNVYAVRG